MQPWGKFRLTAVFCICLVHISSHGRLLGAPPTTLLEVAAEAGIEFIHTNGANGHFYYVESMGSGVCLLDYNSDGWLDIYLVNGTTLPPDPETNPSNRLFQNEKNGTFSNQTENAGVGNTEYGTGACAADYDNDGFVDLCLLNFGNCRVLHNQGNGTFTDVTLAAGINVPGWSVAGAFLDYNRDGLLDLFITRYLQYTLDDHRPCTHRRGGTHAQDYCGPGNYSGLSNLLYKNVGGGRFVDVSQETNIAPAIGKGMGASAADFDHDGWVDLFVSNDQMPNFFFRNVQGKTFLEDALLAGVSCDAGGTPQASMGVAWGDVDNDQFQDLWVPCLSGEVFAIYHNEAGGFFSDVSTRMGMQRHTLKQTGFGALLADFDNDGWLDAFTSNGAVFAHPESNPLTDDYQTCYGQADLLLHNEQGKSFTDVSLQAGPYFSEAHVGRGAACGDLFNNGKICIVINNSGDHPALLKNITPSGKRHWLTIRLVGSPSNRDGIGARLTAFAGPDRWSRQVTAGGSLFSQNDIRPHFGLDQHPSLDRLEIDWPSGNKQILENIPADQILTIHEE